MARVRSWTATPAALFPRREALLAAAVLALLALAGVLLRLRPAEIFGGGALASLRTMADRLWPPNLESAVLARAGHGLYETLAISVSGTALGAVLGLLLAPFCAQALRPPAAVRYAARLAANVLRTVPYFVWAVLFWFMVGLGPFPGALAIAVHTGGVLARLYANAFDSIDPRPLEALRAIGSRRGGVFLFGALPEARPGLVSYTLYRWEVNIREAAVLGLVGSGGLGFHVQYSLAIFDWSSLATYLAAMIVLVLGADAVSARLRRALL